VIVPRPARMGPIERLRRSRAESKVARALAPYDRIQVTLVSDHEDNEHEHQIEPLRLLAPRSLHDAVVLVDRPDRATMRAVRYALAIGADEVRAVHAAVDPDVQEELIAKWMELAVPIELDLVECWDRDLVRALERFMVERMRPSGETTVVLPRRDYATLPQRILHDRTFRKIARALGRYRHTDIAVIPYHFAKRAPMAVDGTPKAPDPARAR